MRWCSKCVMPDTRPDTQWYGDVCSACVHFEKRSEIDWEARKQELLRLLDCHDGKCIVPSSGGKDSHAQVLMLKELGADVTVVTATTDDLSDIGKRNIQNLARYAPTYEITPNQTVRRKIARLGLRLVGDISYGEHIAIWSTPFRAAVRLGIPLMFYGELPQSEYGSPRGHEERRVLDRAWVAQFGGLMGLRISDLVGQEGITEKDMEFYAMPTDHELETTGVTAYFLGQFLPWDGRANAERAKAAGMEFKLPTAANWWTFENLDNLQTSAHDALRWAKFGYGRCADQLSADIRRGVISRDYALMVVREKQHLFPYWTLGVNIEETLGRAGITLGDFLDVYYDYAEASGLFNVDRECHELELKEQVR